MTLYYFNPNDYGQEYTVMSDSKEGALNSVKSYLLSKMNEDPINYTVSIYNKWNDSTIDNLPDDYSIDEYKLNEVIETFYG